MLKLCQQSTIQLIPACSPSNTKDGMLFTNGVKGVSLTFSVLFVNYFHWVT